jgi:hypothetical protein
MAIGTARGSARAAPTRDRECWHRCPRLDHETAGRSRPAPDPDPRSRAGPGLRPVGRASGPALDVALGARRFPGYGATVAERGDAIAAINGDMGVIRPAHPFARDGELVQTLLPSSDVLGIAGGGVHRSTRHLGPRPIERRLGPYRAVESRARRVLARSWSSARWPACSKDRSRVIAGYGSNRSMR